MTSPLHKKHNFDPVFDSQKAFRLLLEAQSYPLRVLDLGACIEKMAGDSENSDNVAWGRDAILVLGMTLLDTEVSFAVVNGAVARCALAEEVTTLTLSGLVELFEADFIFVDKEGDVVTAIKNAKSGTLADPHKSATIVVYDSGPLDHEVAFYGPGIDGRITKRVSRRVIEAIAARDMQYYEYPQGVDLFFVSDAGDLFALPRTVRMDGN